MRTVWLFFVALLIVANSANAQSTATLTQYQTRSIANTAQTATGWQNSKSIACNVSMQQSLAWYQSTYPTAGFYGTLGSTDPTCNYTLTRADNGGVLTASGYTYSTQSGTGSLGCPSAGDARSINMTLGYTHDPSADKSASVGTYADKYVSMRTAGSMCASGGGSACAVTFDAAGPSMVWISASPNAQGLYRISVDQKVVYTGATCTLSANERMVTESTDAGPACDGIYGVVNGKAVCVPSNSGSRNLVQSQTGTSNTPRQVGNPAAGSSAGLPIAARTPSAGTGSNDGGPVTPLDGSPAPLGSPLPTTPVTKSSVDLQLTGQCGASGQPPCKIDESGTPGSGEATSATSHSSLDSAWQSATDSLTTITSAQGKDTSWGVMPTWFQSTTCAPFVLGHFPPPVDRDISIDICPVIPYANGVMNFLWVAFTFFATLAMVFRVMTNAKV